MLLPEVATRRFPVKKTSLLKTPVRVPFLKKSCRTVPESLFHKSFGLRPATPLKNRLWHSCFSVSFAKFSRTSFLQNTFGRLLLCMCSKIMINPECSASNLTTITWLVCGQVIHFFNEHTTISMNTAAEIRLYCTKTEVFY